MPPAENDPRRNLVWFGYAIGGTQLVLYIAMIVYSIVLLTTADSGGPATESVEYDDNSTLVVDETTTTESTTSKDTQNPLIFPIVYLLLSAICFVTVILLLYGLAKKAPEFFLPWIIFHIVAVLVILGIGLFRLTRKHEHKTHNDVDCVLYLFYAGLHFVVIWFIYMLYRMMSEGDENIN